MGVIDKLNQIKSCKEDIKQAIIDKGVDMTDVVFTEYATKISEIETGGGSGDYLDMRANMSTYYSTVEKIDKNAFGYCYSLQSVNLPMCSYVGSSAFTYCTSLQSVNLPMCSYVGGNAFSSCSSLQSIDLPNCSFVGNDTFGYCYSLQSVNLPMCSYVGGYAFERCSSLQSIDLPNCSFVDQLVFTYCSSLQSVNLPNCNRVSYAAFERCYSLQSVNLPNCNYVSDSAFNYCSSLSVLDLRSTYSCILSDSNAFSRTPFASGIGSIYVHAAHLSQFQNATNWTYFSNCFVGVGDPNRPLLVFDSGSVYGDTYGLYSRWTSFLGVASSSVTSIDLPNVKNLSASAVFSIYFSNLTSVSMNNLVSAPAYMCYSCTSLQSVNLPMCSYVGDGAFRYCSSLQSIDLPMCSYVGSSAFESCSSLTSVNLPMCSFVNYYAFNGCRTLQSVNLPNCYKLSDGVFYACYSLSTIYIGTSISTVCEITNVTFTQTNSSFSVFVPMSLVDTYKSDRIWSRYASQIFGV